MEARLNKKCANLQSQINALRIQMGKATTTKTLISSSGMTTIKSPSGAIYGWTGDTADIPVGYSVCDGTYGTPDLTGSFVE